MSSRFDKYSIIKGHIKFGIRFNTIKIPVRIPFITFYFFLTLIHHHHFEYKHFAFDEQKIIFDNNRLKFTL